MKRTIKLDNSTELVLQKSKTGIIQIAIHTNIEKSEIGTTSTSPILIRYYKGLKTASVFAGCAVDLMDNKGNTLFYKYDKKISDIIIPTL